MVIYTCFKQGKKIGKEAGKAVYYKDVLGILREMEEDRHEITLSWIIIYLFNSFPCL